MQFPAEQRRIAVIGEVLFDHFPDGRRVLGGAPFNVAWNLQGLGQRPVLISAVGRDADGERILQQMHAWGMSQSLVAKHPMLPTGSVQITLDDNEPSYDIVTEVAYDELAFGWVSQRVDLTAMGVIYHGSLCFRTQQNRDFLKQVISVATCDRFVDLNIRQPWIQRNQIAGLIAGARWIKINADELEWLSEMSVNQLDVSSIEAAITAIAEMSSFELPSSWLVTCGEHGAYWIVPGEESIFEPTVAALPFRDPVGAGDAFSAAVLHGIANGHSRQQTLHHAVRFAAKACTLRGATTTDRAHYDVVITASAPKDHQ